MKGFNEARIALCKCNTSHKIRGVRFEKVSDGWMYNWTFWIKKGMESGEQYDKTIMKGNLICAPEYPGCPACGSKTFLICSECGKLSCDSECPTCQWCGNTGELRVYDGSGVNSNLDR